MGQDICVSFSLDLDCEASLPHGLSVAPGDNVLPAFLEPLPHLQSEQHRTLMPPVHSSACSLQWPSCHCFRDRLETSQAGATSSS